MSELQEPLQQAAEPFKNRRGWLIAFGVVQLLVAAMMFLMAVAIMFVPTAELEKSQPHGAMPFPIAILSVIYGLMGALFAALGIGSILAKNWARIGTLIVSWFWLGIGIVSVLFSALLMPTILQNSPHPPNVPENMNSMVLTFVVVFESLFLIVLPAIFLLFYHTDNVKAAFVRGEQGPRTRPLLMSILIWWFGFGTVSILLAVFSNYPAVLFGFAITGWAGKLVFAGSAIAEGMAMWGYIKRDIRGWWVAMGSSLLWAASALVTHVRGTLPELYSKMGFSQEQLSMFSNPRFQIFGLLLSLFFIAIRIGAVTYTKRYFDSPSGAVPEII